MTPLELAKNRLSIPELATLRGWDWKPGRECRAPYRADKNPSGSVLAEDRLFHDFATGETLDAPALLARVEDIANDAACRLFIELAGVKAELASRSAEMHRNAAAPAPGTRGQPQLPFLSRPREEHLRALATLRGLSVEGVSLAARRGFLHMTRFRGVPCWVLLDAARCLCQVRRLDGELFPRKDAEGYKAHTCKGSRQSWPLGIREAGRVQCIALVEGGGDFLAACHFIAIEGQGAAVAPVGMLGAGQRIAAEALPLFAGKRVRIFAHVDRPGPHGEHPGIEAAARWEQQLSDAGASATTFDLSGLTQVDGKPIKDLNDLARISPEDFEADPELATLMRF